ncbi:Eco57I restriction-modification methylase domain-containing protein [Glutamicibacter ardleyensis]|uniref:Eco57I restriction-modification methylase domain-containing protein n=1 Tax=Glutamicibacter ardleyensis TaxID=225894 RepID=UPI003FD4C824
MANLFSRLRVLQEAEKLLYPSLAKDIAILESWRQDHVSGSLKKDKEESREQAFNTQIFGKILGYVEKPANIYTFESKPKTNVYGGETPDGLLCFRDTALGLNNTFAVVELKGGSADLDKPQKGYKGQLSPVQQAFKYKPQFDRCPFVIVSNFWEMRLYNDNQLDYEVWTLNDLVDPKDDYANFKVWYTLLCADNMTSTGTRANTEELLKAVRIDQERIGNEFYEVYRSARLELLRDMYRRNALVREDISVGINKAQKLVDRIIFSCFAEDCGLLPEDTLRDRVKVASEVGLGSLWDAMKVFFQAVDQGNPKLNIPVGYNGGLFRDDEILNNLDIDDAVLLTLLNFDRYNFQEDLGVTILGHLFEQSITDLEDIRESVESAKGIEGLTVSRRKRDGIVYTPDYIVRHIVDRTLGEHVRRLEMECRERAQLHDALNQANYSKREREAYLDYQTKLGEVRVVDPACGSGAFLVHVFDFLMLEYERIGKITGDLFSTEAYVKQILRNNIYGVDLNEESVEITKLSLWLKSATKNEKLTSLDDNILCGNSLISDATVAGTKAFVWETTFSKILNTGGFDVVVGNPPYVQSHIMVATNPEERAYISATYETAKGNWDLFVPFIERGLALLKIGGSFGYIVPNKVLGQEYARTLRHFISRNYALKGVVDVSQDGIFEKVAVYPVILLIDSRPTPSTISITKSMDPLVTADVPYSSAAAENWTPLISSDSIILSQISRFGVISDQIDVFNSAAVDEAYKMKPLLSENPSPSDEEFKILTTGGVDPYVQMWGSSKTKYLKDSYDHPVIRRDAVKQKTWTNQPRIVIGGMGVRFEVFPDLSAEYLPTIPSVVLSTDSLQELLYLTAILNSKMMSDLYTQLHASNAMSGGYLTFTADRVKTLPYVPYDELNKSMSEIVDHAKLLVDLLPKELHLNRDLLAFLVDSYALKPSREMSREILTVKFDLVKSRLPKNLPVKTVKEISDMFQEQRMLFDALRAKTQKAWLRIETLVLEVYALS